MSKSKNLVTMLLLLSLVSCHSSNTVVAQSRNEFLPDPQLTPGAVMSNVTLEQICTSGYTKTVRNVPAALKKRVYREYGIRYVAGAYEVDHLIPLALGASNSIRNLWPEPYDGEWGARVKDDLELAMYKKVCRGSMSLTEAQQAIATNWIETYKQVFHTDRPRVQRHRERGGY